ncbi:MAG: 30S ribosomal protein S4 [Candidatus Lokiarchaeota archaeon]|nr:30S ribosomal protein S4 [Candidatus Lokiarchaeota archaeon]
MGDPRKLRKKFKRPRVPFEKVRIDSELRYLGEYGLRNKRELSKHRFQLSKFRRMARDLKTMPEDVQKIMYNELLSKLHGIALVDSDATTDDVLSLSVENILDRRLQTMVFKKGLARSIYQARQLIAHKHIAIQDKVISSPSYLVKADEEEHLKFHNYSPFSGKKEKIFGEKIPLKEESTSKETTSPRKRSRKISSKKSTSKN